ncbi:MAG TPA: DNA polymerase III subunit delta' [Myxococcota bacterium]|nr:DNA polymerase III subunit delta' [Myxococcota bacterium]
MAAGGSGEIRAELARARGTGKVHSAYLFDGPPGTGKLETALWFAQLLLCKGAPAAAAGPCGTCHDCRLFATGAHPDLHRVEVDGAWIKVDAVRELRAALSLVANERGRRVGLIADAERLRVEAANALLKTLEEPPPATVLLLVTAAPEALPRTLRSRTVRVRFPRAGEREIAAALEAEGMPADDAALASQLGGASPAAARAWAEESLADARETKALLERVDSLSVTEILDFAEGFRRPGDAGRDQARAFIDVQSAFARARAEAAAAAGETRALERWLRAFESASAARLELERRNLNPQLLVESLLLELRS